MNHAGQVKTFLIGLTWAATSFGANADQIDVDDLATGGSPVIIAEMYSQERRSHGKLQACEIVYKAAFKDQTHRIGNFVSLVGSVSLFSFLGEQKPPEIFLKAGAFDMGHDGGKVDPIDLEYLYLSTSSENLSGKEAASFECGESGKSLCVAYDAFENVEALKELSFRFEVNYTESGASFDITVPINVLIHDERTFDKHNKCVLNLLNEAQSSLQ